MDVDTNLTNFYFSGDLSTVNNRPLKLPQNGLCGGGALGSDGVGKGEIAITANNQKTLCSKFYLHTICRQNSDTSVREFSKSILFSQNSAVHPQLPD